MSAKWGDMVCAAMSFDELSKPTASAPDLAQLHYNRRLSQAKLIHLSSLMHAVALQYLRRDSDLGHLKVCCVGSGSSLLQFTAQALSASVSTTYTDHAPAAI